MFIYSVTGSALFRDRDWLKKAKFIDVVYFRPDLAATAAQRKRPVLAATAVQRKRPDLAATAVQRKRPVLAVTVMTRLMKFKTNRYYSKSDETI